MRQPPSSDIIVAAGAVCWRVENGELTILLVHRKAQADVSLPKGKVDRGESTPQTAVREIEEETGLRVSLGPPLGSIEYTIAGDRNKVVHYWTAEVSDEAIALSSFSPNHEIASLEWLPVGKARQALSYERDREVLDRFVELVSTSGLGTFAIITVRHGKTVPPMNWDGPDSTRPLLHRGLEQAASIAPAIAAFGPVKLISSTAARCRATLEPLSSLTGLPLTLTADISQAAHERGDAQVVKIVQRRLAKKKSTVLCSHGPVLPDIIAELAGATGTPINTELRRASQLSTGEFTVLHLSREHPEHAIVAVETHSPLA